VPEDCSPGDKAVGFSKEQEICREQDNNNDIHEDREKNKEETKKKVIQHEQDQETHKQQEVNDEGIVEKAKVQRKNLKVELIRDIILSRTRGEKKERTHGGRKGTRSHVILSTLTRTLINEKCSPVM
jgi:hypothetical protein